MATSNKFHKALVSLLFLVCFFLPANSAFQSVKAETADVAGSATTVYAKVSKSVVIVEALSPDGRAQGSGVVYDSDEAYAEEFQKMKPNMPGSYIVTNAHVVKNASSVSVLQGGKPYRAGVEYVDDVFDLAFLAVRGVLLPISRPFSGAQLKVGEKVFAVGSPLGLENTISEGIISGKRELNGVLHLQTTAPISEGSSGGGLFDVKGRFVGITRGKFAGGENLNFAVDAGRVCEVEVALNVSYLLRLQANGYRSARKTGKRNFSPEEMALINSKALVDWLLKTRTEKGETLSSAIDRSWAKVQDSSEQEADFPIENLQILARFLSDQTGRTANSQNAPEEKEQEVAKARETDQDQHNRAANELSARDWFEKGLALFKSGKYQDGIEAYSKAIELDPKYAEAYNNRGITFGKLRNYRQAIRDYDRAIKLDPKYAAAYFNRGTLYVRDFGNYKQAIRDYDKAIEINPNYLEAYNNRGVAYKNLGDYHRAVRDYDRAIKLDPKHTSAYINRGLAYGNLGDYRQAIRDYDKAIELDPKYALAYYYRGVASGKLGEYHRAVRDYDRAIEMNPKDAQAYSNRGDIYNNLGDYQQAIRDCDKAIELNSNFAAAYYNRGSAYGLLGNYIQAIKDFDRAIELDPKDAGANYLRGLAYDNLGNYQQAIRNYDRAIELEPKYAPAYYNRGYAYNNLGNHRQEIEDYKTAAKLGHKPAQDILRSKGISW